MIEESSQTNRWRRISPAAKASFSMCGMIAAYAAATPAAACGVAAALGAVTILGADVPPGRYLRVAAPALLFLTVSAFSLTVSLELSHGALAVALPLGRGELQRVAQVCARSLAGLASLLFLALTTPLLDLVGLLRSLRTPEVMLDIMVLCYRTLFVFSEAVRDTITAQTSRLGYATARRSLRSLGSLMASLIIQVWRRSNDLHLAALARNGDGPLRFLERPHPSSARDLRIALCGGIALVAFALGAS
ncbi:MAG TPA: cobalt ECF transporter T component CbiQ [Anaeromyxobacteraceae bacterium]